jgi:hypothetical protein
MSDQLIPLDIQWPDSLFLNHLEQHDHLQPKEPGIISLILISRVIPFFAPLIKIGPQRACPESISFLRSNNLILDPSSFEGEPQPASNVE